MDGVYSFTWTYMTRKGTKAYIGGVIDDKQIVWTAIYDQTAILATTPGHLVVRMKKGSQFWTPNTSKYVTNIEGYFTYLSGYKISDKWFYFLNKEDCFVTILRMHEIDINKTICLSMCLLFCGVFPRYWGMFYDIPNELCFVFNFQTFLWLPCLLLFVRLSVSFWNTRPLPIWFRQIRSVEIQSNKVMVVILFISNMGMIIFYNCVCFKLRVNDVLYGPENIN